MRQLFLLHKRRIRLRSHRDEGIDFGHSLHCPQNSRGYLRKDSDPIH